MMQGIGNEHSLRQLKIIEAASKKNGHLDDPRDAAIASIPSDIVIKNHTIPENSSSHSRTLPTMTETFTSGTWEDDTTLMSSSLAYIDSFEVHEGLNAIRGTNKAQQVAQQLQTEFSASHEELASQPATRKIKRWPTDFYRGTTGAREKYNSSAQRPVAPPSLFLSSDSWDDDEVNNGKHREVSLLDMMVDSRDDDEEDEGHDGDDERTTSKMEKMKQMTMSFQQSHDDTLSSSPVVDPQSLPKFAQGPLSHLRNNDANPRPSFAVMTRTLQPNYTSGSSFATMSPHNHHVSPEEAYLKSVEKAEKDKKMNEKSIMEKKGLFQSFKDLIISCAPNSESD